MLKIRILIVDGELSIIVGDKSQTLEVDWLNVTSNGSLKIITKEGKGVFSLILVNDTFSHNIIG